jgi:hypothetical protein
VSARRDIVKMGAESVKLMWLDGFCLIFIFLADISVRGQIKDRKSVLLFWDKLHIMKKVNVQENVHRDNL